MGRLYFLTFCIKSGVRQGGVLSPALFNMYVRSLIVSLIKSNLGCHVYGVCTGCLVYADDVILLSATVLQLQKMLDIVFNAKKSSFFAVEKLLDCNLLNLNLGSDVISWSESEVSWLVF